MKLVYFFLLLLHTISSFLQEDNKCNIFDISQGEVSALLNLKTPNDFIILARRISDNYDDRKIIFKTQVQKCDNLKGVFLKLSNYEIVAFEDYNLLCDDLPEGGRALSGSITLTDDLYRKLLRHTIVEFNLGGNGVLVKFEFKEEFASLLTCLHLAK